MEGVSTGDVETLLCQVSLLEYSVVSFASLGDAGVLPLCNISLN